MCPRKLHFFTSSQAYIMMPELSEGSEDTSLADKLFSFLFLFPVG